MITNRGKEIVAKYMLGQVPAYATHISLGCGSRPRITGSIMTVTNKELTSGVAYITTVTAHQLQAGQRVIVSGMGAPFDGTHYVRSVSSPVIFELEITNTNIVSAAATGTVVIDYSDKQTMDFEMVRIPITSRGFVNDGGIDKIAFAAEMPTEDRYAVTEVALWSAGSNANALSSNSRVIFSFDQLESWKWKVDYLGTDQPVPLYTEPLEGVSVGSGDINVTDPNSLAIVTKALESGTSEATLEYTGDIAFSIGETVQISGVGAPFDGAQVVTGAGAGTFTFTVAGTTVTTTAVSPPGLAEFGATVFAAMADNAALMNSSRINRQEGARFLDYGIMLRGDTSAMDGLIDIDWSNSHISLEGRNLPLSAGAPNDEIKIAMSILSRVASNNIAPYSTRIRVEFCESESGLAPLSQKAVLTHEIFNTDLGASNRYFVINKKMSDIVKTDRFSWSNVKVTKVYVSIYKSEIDADPSNEYFVLLDSLRFDNISTPNPLYVMTGYSPVDTIDAHPIYKVKNTSNYIEFRLGIGVG